MGRRSKPVVDSDYEPSQESGTGNSPTQRGDVSATATGVVGRDSRILTHRGSPTRVSGKMVGTNATFSSGMDDVCKVDKTLICKGFWDSFNKVGRVCLPRRFGKTYNMTILRLFFSSGLDCDELDDISGSTLTDDGGSAATTSRTARIEDVYQEKRRMLFEESLLEQEESEFFDTHFARYPVLHIVFGRCGGPSFGDFLISICTSIAVAAKKLINEIEMRGLELSIFEELSDFVRSQFGRYMLFVDEYDTPFITIQQAAWDEDLKERARAMLKALYKSMIKYNDNILKGLITGVFAVSLAVMGSGANDIEEYKAIEMPETEDTDDELTALWASETIEYPHRGVNYFLDSFAFNSQEVSALIDKACVIRPSLRGQKDTAAGILG
ncbi:hypothetical protein GQ54DRAFT_310718 [Martensiomyces pterosporus]|nr:hypothetical protein GQ54DRAFT_310718 [Martensiomyces pterosporus]